jgi:hypothetical protein
VNEVRTGRGMNGVTHEKRYENAIPDVVWSI